MTSRGAKCATREARGGNGTARRRDCRGVGWRLGKWALLGQGEGDGPGRPCDGAKWVLARGLAAKIVDNGSGGANLRWSLRSCRGGREGPPRDARRGLIAQLARAHR